tara:strand:- start:1950 stop:2399 length:450 start_codon:yes stop_codon:yes gene_type:complete
MIKEGKLTKINYGNMKEEERKIMYVLNQYGSKLKEDMYEYNRYDAYNNTSIVEIKYRHTFYDNTMIELDKYSYNLVYSKLINKKFIYAVRMEQYIYVFNITELTKNNYDFKFGDRQMPKTTEHKRKDMIKKVVGYININDAIIKFRVFN